MPVRLHVRVLVLALAAMLVVPTIGRLGAEDVPTAATTAAMAAAEASNPEAPAPDTDPAPAADSEERADAAEAPAAQRDVAARAEVQEAPAPDQAPAGDAPPAEASGDGLLAKGADADAAPKKKAVAADRKAAAASQGRQPAQSRAAAAAKPAGSVRSLYLAIGHGRDTDGTWQPGAEHPGSGAFEVDAARVMVEAMRKEFEGAPNLELHYEGGNNHPNMIGSVARANKLGVDDCIEVHQDTAAAPPGAFVHWYTGADSAKRLADRVVSNIADAGVETRWDWHRERPGLYFLRKSDCRAVLVEVGRVGDFGTEQLRELGRQMAQAYLTDTAKMRGVAAG